MRTNARPEGHRRETLCGLLAQPVTGHYFHPTDPRACTTCRHLTQTNPLRYPINPSNELSNLRALLTDIHEQRIPATDALNWIQANTP
jgi:hypothetical protein